MKKRLNSSYVKKQLLNALRFAVTFSSFIGVFIALIPFDEKWWINAITIASVFVLSFVIVALILLMKRKRKIGECNNVSINAMYGDILNINVKNNEVKPVIVIPVNSAYDYIVEDNLDIENPIVSPKTLHGKWIVKITNGEAEKIEQLRKDIEKGIKVSGLEVIKRLENKRGNKEQYKLGSAIFVERDDCTYLLFALTDFDEKNHVVERHVRIYSNLINDLINETGRCQGRDVYVPVMGVGLSLFGLDHKHAFEIMKATIINQKNTLKSSINIVIFDGDRDKVSIYD